tara:strand:+ start:95 stop:493 length:399 start_codon:yes stop_codon:yes gene_type:complete
MKYNSKALIISIFLYIFSIANCFADFNWKKIGSNTDGDVSYVDLSSIKKVGNNVFFFRLMDYIKPNEQGDLSSKIYFEVNCLDLSFRYIKDFYYKQPMGNGEYTIYDKIGEWENNTKGSIGEGVRKFACNYN